MMVIFVSQCEKNALKKTRRVLDAFADRIGDNTWQTLITQDGLHTVRKLLKKTASKSTAVSCHWLRSRSRSELVWVVGNRMRFNTEGLVPVNRTSKPFASSAESDWHYLPLIQALVGIAALLHDWGKASALFQKKLQQSQKKGDPIRHEWISMLLLYALVSNQESDNGDPINDENWLKALQSASWNKEIFTQFSNVLTENKGRCLHTLPPVAQLVAWLIISHHRLPLPQHDEIKAYREEKTETLAQLLKLLDHTWGYQNKDDAPDYAKRLAACFQFPHGFLDNSGKWQKELKKWAGKLRTCLPLAHQALADGSYRVVLHHARLCLMLADHYYSSQDAEKGWPNTTSLFANTDPKNGGRLKQKLDEHLVGVAKQGVRNVWLLPAFVTAPEPVYDNAALRKKSPPQFAWQDTAVAKIRQWRTTEPDQSYGFFVVNMASTGQGKTFANAKIMRALSADQKSLRYVLALGLRTLTLQTGDEYRHRIGLDSTEMAVLIGSRAVADLHHLNSDPEPEEEKNYSGSESEESLLDEEVDYESSLPEDDLATVLRREKDRQFLYAPVLVCTIDHMMAATETTRGGRYILPCLRLLSSDLVIDEVDDFTDHDTVAIGRLIYLAGMLGRKVMISSATIPPDLAEGYFKAYRSGWRLFSKTRNASRVVGCVWVDEFSTFVETHAEPDDLLALDNYRASHAHFIDKRVAKLAAVLPKRMVRIVNCETVRAAALLDKQSPYFQLMAQAALELHQEHHTIDAQSRLPVSFGVMRVANINPCVALTRYLLEYEWPEDTLVCVMAYHSQQVLLLRHEQEKHLDQVLVRKEASDEQPKAFRHPVIRAHLDGADDSIKRVLFILVATPVEEVGRDHDFDWAVVEPSSFRSLVQLGGRVLRHRHQNTTTPNMAVMEYNWRGIVGGRQAQGGVFNKPGFEVGKLLLTSHSLNKLLDTKELAKKLDAVPRIQKPERTQFKPKDNLVHLEHAATKLLLTMPIEKSFGPVTQNGYLWEHWYLSGLPQRLTKFRAGDEHTNIHYLLTVDDERAIFHERDRSGVFNPIEWLLNIQHIVLTPQAMERLWLKRDYQQALDSVAELLEISPRAASYRFGELNFRYQENKEYQYNDQLGLVKKE